MISDYTNNEYCNPFDEKPQNFFMKLEHCGRYLYALDNIAETDVVADIACATGYGSALLAQKAKSVIGLDVNDEYLTQAKQQYLQANLEFKQIDLNQNISLPKINTIVSFETIEHTPQPFMVIQKFYDVLPNGGRLILSFPNADCEMIDDKGQSLDRFHLSIIKFNEMIDRLEQIGFKINKILGQSFVNKVIAQVLQMEQDLHLSFDALYNYDKQNIITQSRLLAYPNEENIQDSYSFIFDVEKIS